MTRATAFTAFLLASSCLFAQRSPYDARIHLPIEEGTDLVFLPVPLENGSTHSTVWQITKDSLGFLWFSTSDGLKRFDGYHFRDVRPEAGSPYSLSGREVKPLFNDRSGKLWVASDLSVARYDPVTERFTRFSPAVLGPIHDVYQDRAGMIWITTPRGLVRMDPATDASTLVGPKLTNVLRSSFEDSTGTFWVSARESIEILDRRTGEVRDHIPLKDAAAAASTRTTNINVSLIEDHAGVLWVASERDGLAMVDRRNNRLQYFALASGSDVEAEPGARAILEDREGVLWVGTKNGLYRLDRDRKRLVRYRHDSADPDSLSSNYVSALLEDEEGGMWAGMDRGGVVRFSIQPLFRRDRPPHPNQRDPSDYVASAHQDRQGNVWIGGKGILIRMDHATARLTSYPLGGVRGGFAYADVLSIAEDSSGKLWLATWGGGIHRLDPRNGAWKVYRHNAAHPSSLNQDSVFTLLFDRDGRLWAGTETGLNAFDQKMERFQFYSVPELGNNRERAIAEDAQGVLWLATLYTGLHRFDPTTGRFTVYRHSETPGSLSNDAVAAVLVDHTGTVWAGTANGLNRFDAASGKFSVYYERDGLGGMSVTGIQEDQRGNLWLTTNRGLSRFDRAGNTFQNYYRADGVPADVTSIWKAPGGEFLVGSYNGLIRFSPESLMRTQYTPPVVLTDFRLNDLSAPIGGSSPLRQSISLTKSLTLSHDQRIFAFDFAALSFANPQLTRYRYTMENLDSGWHEVDSTQRSVRYTTLDPGNYVFRVQSRTNGGVWSENGSTVRIQVLPAWWNTPWFRASSALALGLVLWAAYQLRLMQVSGQLKLRFEERLRERNRIAGELHDTLLQGFLSASMQLDVMADTLPRDSPMKARLNRILELMSRVTTEGRNALQGLREPYTDLLRLEQILAQIELEFQGQTGGSAVAFRVAVEGRSQQLHPVFRDEVYSIGREAIVNAFRHSRATTIEVDVAYTRRRFRLTVRDNGRGMDADRLRAGREGHRGLRGMRERAERIGGDLHVWSRPGVGTRVEMSAPGHIAFQRSGERGFLRRGVDALWRTVPQRLSSGFRVNTQKVVGKDSARR